MFLAAGLRENSVNSLTQSTKARTTFAAAILVSGIFSSCSASAAPFGANIVVIPPAELPESARVHVEAMMLRTDDDGMTYLYLEQEQGAKLTVLDVTDPSRIKALKTVDLVTPGPFDFVSPFNSRAELILFRGTGRQAIIDLRRPQNPVYRDTSESKLQGDGIMIHNRPDEMMEPVDYQIVDGAGSRHASHIMDVKGVKQELTNDGTGTTFLLARDGLFVIRRPPLEGVADRAALNSGG
jgi:hypothetical protein